MGSGEHVLDHAIMQFKGGLEQKSSQKLMEEPATELRKMKNDAYLGGVKVRSYVYNVFAPVTFIRKHLLVLTLFTKCICEFFCSRLLVGRLV